MEDLNKLLEGNAPDVIKGLGGKSHDDLLKLKAAETEGKARKGVLEAIDAELKNAETNRAQGVVEIEPRDGYRQFEATSMTAASLDTSSPAGIAPADAIDTSGAPQQIVPDVDMSHPAVDADPRAGSTDVQNRIDFNDPTISGANAVKAMLQKNAG